MFKEQLRKCRDCEHVGVKKERNGGNRENVGAATEDQRIIYGSRIQKKRAKMGTIAQADG